MLVRAYKGSKPLLFPSTFSCHSCANHPLEPDIHWFNTHIPLAFNEIVHLRTLEVHFVDSFDQVRLSQTASVVNHTKVNRIPLRYSDCITQNTPHPKRTTRQCLAQYSTEYRRFNIALISRLTSNRAPQNPPQTMGSGGLTLQQLQTLAMQQGQNGSNARFTIFQDITSTHAKWNLYRAARTSPPRRHGSMTEKTTCRIT